jgi:hypothetical protein
MSDAVAARENLSVVVSEVEVESDSAGRGERTLIAVSELL